MKLLGIYLFVASMVIATAVAQELVPIPGPEDPSPIPLPWPPISQRPPCSCNEYYNAWRLCSWFIRIPPNSEYDLWRCTYYVCRRRYSIFQVAGQLPGVSVDIPGLEAAKISK